MIQDTESPAGLGSTAGQIQETNELTNVHQNTRGKKPVKGDAQFLQVREPSPLELAKAIIPDIFTLAEVLGWPLEGPGKNFAWYRDNTDTPSLNLREDGEVWFDFALGQGGGAIDLLALVENLDRKEACRRFIEISAEVQTKMSLSESMRAYEVACHRETAEEAQGRAAARRTSAEADKSDARSKWKAMYPLDTPTDDELTQIITLRHWPLSAGIGLRHAIHRGLLFSLQDYRNPAFVVTDSDRCSAKKRKFDGQPWLNGAKALCFPGSENRWPIGTAAIQNGDHAILVEGETDQLAMICLLEMFAPETLATTTVISLSASTPIHPAAMMVISARAKCMTIIGDADDAGRAAVDRWTQQLEHEQFPHPVRRGAVSAVDHDAKDISDLLSLLTNTPDLHSSLREWVGSITTTETDHQDQL